MNALFLRRSTRSRSASPSNNHSSSSSFPQHYSQPSISTDSGPTLNRPILTQPSSPTLKRQIQKISNSVLPLLLDIVQCGICQKDCDGPGLTVIGCDGECKKWFHIECVNMSHSTFTSCYVNQAGSSWLCHGCRKTLPNIPGPFSIVA